MTRRRVAGLGLAAGILLALTLSADQEIQRMGKISVVIPEATTNLITNPSFEDYIDDNDAGWTPSGGSDTVLPDVGYRGGYADRVTPTAGVNDGVYYAITLATTTTYTFTVRVKGESGVPYQLRAYDVTGTADLATATFTGDGTYREIELTFTTGANTSHRLYVEKNNSADTNYFYVDAAQCEAKAYATTYCDGDQEGCEWDGERWKSTSSRSAQSRAGGRVYDLASDYDLVVSSFEGLGMAPVQHITQEFAQEDGAHLQNIRTRPRVVSLSLVIGGEGTEAEFYSDWQTLNDAIKPDAVKGLQPVILRYTGTDEPVELQCFYDGGLEGSWKHLNHETTFLRLICYQPYARELIEQSVEMLDTSAETEDYDEIRLVAAKIDNDWTNLGPPSAGTFTRIYDIVIGKDGIVYVCGDFLNMDGIAAADYIASYDVANDTWAALHATPPDNIVYTMALSPDGETLYVGGVFANIGGGAAAKIAEYDISAGTFSAMGTGANGDVNDLAVSPNGLLYIVGEFTTLGGGAAAYVGSWDGSAYAALDSGLGAAGNTCEIGPEGDLYVGGDFTTVDGAGTAAAYVGRWDVAEATWYALGDGLGDVVDRIAVGPDGNVYAGGVFTTLGSGGAAVRLAYWNGSAWAAMGGGVPDTVWAIQVAADGSVWIGGEFEYVNDLSLQDQEIYLTRWIDGQFVYADWLYNAASKAVTALRAHGEDLYVGTDMSAASGTWSHGADNAVTNDGSAAVKPQFIIRSVNGSIGEGTWLLYLRNDTTGQEIFFDYFLQFGEELVVDFEKGTVVSSFWGPVGDAVLPNSDLETFELLPGDNQITLFCRTLVSNTYAHLRWRPQHWSVAGAE